MGSLSLVVFKHRLYDQLLRNVRGDLSIGFGSVGVFRSEDSEALSYMVMSFFCQVKLSGSLQLALTVLDSVPLPQWFCAGHIHCLSKNDSLQ